MTRLRRLLALLNHPLVAAALGTAVTPLRGLIILPLVTKLLSPEDYGLWAQLGVASALLTMIATAGMDSASLRYLAGERGSEKDGAFTAIWLTALGLAAVLGVGCIAAAPLLPAGEARFATMMLAALLLGLVAERAALTQVRRLERYWDFAASLALLAAIDVLSIGAALLASLGVAGAVLSWGLFKLLACAGILVYSQLRYRALAAPRFQQLGRMLRFGLPLIVVATLFWMLNLSDRFLIGWFLGLRDVAFYSASYAIGGLAALPFWPVFVIAVPRASGLWEDGRRAEGSMTLWTRLEWSVWLAMPVLGALLLFAPAILARLTRPEYAEAALSAGIVAVAMCVQQVSGFAETELTLYRHSRALPPIYAAAAFTNVAANLLLLPRLGYVGAAVATLAGMIVLAALSHFAVLRAPGWTLRFDRMAVAMAVAAGAVLAVAVLRAFDERLTAPAMAATLLVYGVIGWRMMRGEPPLSTGKWRET